MIGTEYTFAGVSFIRLTGDEYEAWSYPTAEYTKDAVLDGDGVYIDIGANVYPPLSFRASCASQSDRTTLVNAQRTTGTVANDKGHSNTAVLIKAIPINSNPQSLWQVEVLFEIVP